MTEISWAPRVVVSRSLLLSVKMWRRACGAVWPRRSSTPWPWRVVSPAWRRHSSTGVCLQYSENGDPEKVVVRRQVEVASPGGGQVSLDTLAHLPCPALTALWGTHYLSVFHCSFPHLSFYVYIFPEDSLMAYCFSRPFYFFRLP